MIVRTTRWFLIAAPVVAGILVLIFGTAGSISTAFGIVLIGIGPIVWLWNWLVRMSFGEDARAGKPPASAQQADEPESPQRVHREPPPHNAPKNRARPPRRRP